jgi:DNA-directed RNA polymerase specialized sigma24 family protein
MALPPFQAFLAQHRSEVFRLLVASVGREEAEDCFQETFLAALRAYPALRPGSDLRAWVLTIARRKAIDAHRGRGRRPIPRAELPDGTAPDRVGLAGEAWRGLATLPPKQRTGVFLRHALDLPYAEIAEALDSSEPAARRSVHEGLKRLKETER